MAHKVTEIFGAGRKHFRALFALHHEVMDQPASAGLLHAILISV